MNLKKKLKKFFTLKRRPNDGFTLVELIVVIAIMGILGGVGTVGYSGYIKSANKNADKVLVGNIIRAIETGTNSTMFVNDDSFTKGSTTYPVGVITLSTESDCSVMTSSSTVNKSIEACEIGSIEVVSSYTTTPFTNDMGLLETIMSWINITPKENLTQYNLTTKTVSYCTVHTNLPTAETVNTKVEFIPVYKTISTPFGSSEVKIGDYYDYTANATYVFLEDCTGIFSLKDSTNGHVVNGSISKEELTALPSGGRVTASTSGPLYESLTAAFGSDLSALTLKYSGWGNNEDEGHTYATLQGYANEVMANINDTAKLLISVEDYASGYLSDDYEDAADLLDSFSNHLLTRHQTEESWINAWNGAKSGGIDYTFGMDDGNSYHHDFVYAATKSYNSAFASYCKANDVDPTYVAAIEDYTTPPNGAGLASYLDIIPRTVNSAAFNGALSVNSNKTLKDQFRNASDTDTDIDADAAFEQCKKLYESYINSPVCQKNGEVLYNTMNTVKQTGAEAYNSNASTDPNAQTKADDYFAYYGNYFNEMAAFYQAVDIHSGDGIAIVVTVENGVVTCDVTPESANPRNEN